MGAAVRHRGAFSDYVVLPPTGLYRPTSAYHAKTLGKDWGDHLLYSTTMGAVLCALIRW
ncbi:MAG: hypothetical protein ACRDZX_14775 [Acidimicrobiales bacterium]